MMSDHVSTPRKRGLNTAGTIKNTSRLELYDTLLRDDPLLCIQQMKANLKMAGVIRCICARDDYCMYITHERKQCRWQ